MLDSYFRRAVVLICETHDQGVLGFIVNKPLDINVNEILGSFDPSSVKVMYGGPVSTDTVHFIHDAGELIDDSVYIADGVYWGGDIKKLKFLLEKQVILADQVKFFVGYTGWSPSQLQSEIETGSWVVAQMDRNYIFNKDHDDLWKTIMENLGDAYSVIGQMPDHMHLN